MAWHAFLFASSLIAFFVVSTSKSEILKNTTTKSWMSRENFTSLIKVSFGIPQCANIFICDQTAGTERLFKEFISIYRYEFTLNNTVEDCDSYLLVAASEDSVRKNIIRLPTINSNTEILIVIDKDVKKRSKIFNIYLYLLSNVNIATRNGLWTLSENYMDPREFKQVSRYDEMEHKKGIVNLEGVLLHATTFYNPPLCFLQTTVNREVEGIEAEFFTQEDESELDGVELILFMMFAERLNFTWTIRKPSGDHRYGRPNGSHWEDGVIGQMFRRETDFAFGGIGLFLENYKFVKLTTPWKQLHINFLVPRPKPHASFWALTTPLSPEVWALILAMLITQSICVYTRAWVNPQIPKRFRSFTKTWTELMGRLVGTTAPRNMQSLKLQFHLWHIIGVLMVTAYSSSLAAKLARRDYDKRIDTFKDFIAANLTWGRQGPRPLFEAYFDHSDPYGKKFFDRFEHETSEAERHEKILKGNYAIIGNLISSAFFPQNSIRNEDLKNYRLMKESMGNYYATFAITPWLAESVDMLLLWMQEAGLVQYHLDDVLHRRMSTALREVLIEHDVNNGEARVLELTPLGAGLSLYFVGLIISSIVFCLELRSARGSGTIREVLLDIKQNREIWRAKELKRKRVYSMFMELKRKRYGFDRPRKNEWMEEIRRPRPVQMKLMYIP